MRPTHTVGVGRYGKGNLLYSVYILKRQSHSEIPLQTHPEILFNHISGHPRAYSSCHIKLTITSTSRNVW